MLQEEQQALLRKIGADASVPPTAMPRRLKPKFVPGRLTEMPNQQSSSIAQRFEQLKQDGASP